MASVVDDILGELFGDVDIGSSCCEINSPSTNPSSTAIPSPAPVAEYVMDDTEKTVRIAVERALADLLPNMLPKQTPDEILRQKLFDEKLEKLFNSQNVALNRQPCISELSQLQQLSQLSLQIKANISEAVADLKNLREEFRQYASDVRNFKRREYSFLQQLHTLSQNNTRQPQQVGTRR
jgi:hypothetical protein